MTDTNYGPLNLESWPGHGCDRCPLSSLPHHNKIVWGHGRLRHNGIMLIGDAPDKEGNKWGLPLQGKGGAEMDWILQRQGLNRVGLFVDNIVKCQPPNNRDPKKVEIEACERYLWQGINKVKPSVVGTLGGVALRWLLGEKRNLEMEHGIPRWHTDRFGNRYIVVPCLHPESAIHDQNRFSQMVEDFKVLVEVVEVGVEVGGLEGRDGLLGRERYVELDDRGYGRW